MSVKFLKTSQKVATGTSLSAKLLILTVIFVMLAEILIFLPSIGNYRKNWINERMSAAQIAALAVEAAPNNQVPEKLRWELLNNAQVYAVALKKDSRRQLILQSPMPRDIMAHFDLRNTNLLSLIRDAIAVYFQPDNFLIRVVDKPKMTEVQFLEVLMEQGSLKKDMISFALNILGLSIIISIFTAALVYIALNQYLTLSISPTGTRFCRKNRSMLARAPSLRISTPTPRRGWSSISTTIPARPWTMKLWPPLMRQSPRRRPAADKA